MLLLGGTPSAALRAFCIAKLKHLIQPIKADAIVASSFFLFKCPCSSRARSYPAAAGPSAPAPPHGYQRRCHPSSPTIISTLTLPHLLPLGSSQQQHLNTNNNAAPISSSAASCSNGSASTRPREGRT